MVGKEKMAGRWELIPDFILRSTGFPLALIDRLRFECSMVAIQDVLSCDQRVGELKNTFLECFTGLVDKEQARQPQGAPIFSALYGMRRIVLREKLIPETLSAQLPDYPELGGGWSSRWNNALNKLASAYANAENSFHSEMEAQRRELRDMTNDPDFQEALFLSNPNIIQVALPTYWKRWQSDKRSAKVKHIERRLVTYLQRFCMKNDVQSFFGPLNYGHLDNSEESDNILLVRSNGSGQRVPFFAYWGAGVLAQCIATDMDVRPYLRPLINPGYQINDNNSLTILATGEKASLSPSLVRLLTACDGLTTSREIAIHQKIPIQKALKLLSTLEKHSLIRWSLPVAATSVHPLTDLIQQVEDLPDECATRARWLKVLADFDNIRQSYATVGVAAKKEALTRVESLFTQVTGQLARRDAGEMYADRTLLYEECRGNIESFKLGKKLMDDLHRRLTGILDLAATYSCLLYETYHKAGRDLFHSLSPSGRPISFFQFSKNCPNQVDLSGSPAMVFLAQLNDIISERQDMANPNAPVWLESESLGLIDAALFHGRMLVTSPDMMLAAMGQEKINHEAFYWVIGEVHRGLQVYSNLLCLHPESDRLATEIQSWLRPLPGYTNMANLILKERYGKMFYQEVFETSVEVLGHSSQPREQVLPISDLVVLLNDAQLSLSARSTNQPLQLYVGSPDTPLGWMLGPPAVTLPFIDLGSHTPRIMIDGLVYQRETWRVPAGDWPCPSAKKAPFERFLKNWKFKQNLGLPERVFVKTSAERKPFYIDFTNYFLVELLEHLASKGEELVFTEMLPDPTQCWLQDKAGYYTSEFRFSAIRKTEPASC